MKVRRYPGAALLALACFATASCSSGGSTVTGSVKLDGQPFPSATVTFHPREKLGTVAATARTDGEGKFTIRAPKGRPPIPPGNYVVTVRKMVDKKGNVPNDEDYGQLDAAGQLVNKAPPKYADTAFPTLTVEVKSGETNLPPLDLESR
jgi:hypothetical protein